MKIQFLKFINSGLLTGMPPLVYNPFTKLPLTVPLKIEPNSLYVNFKLSETQSTYINKYINKHASLNSLQLVPISLFPNENPANYLSINIYNCTSPVFLNDNIKTTRCEINTYVEDSNGERGTIILDYLSNGLSMDPVNIFKQKDKTEYFKKDKNKFIINCESLKEKISLKLKFSNKNAIEFKLNEQLTKYSDFIYYKNGIYDKLYYDSTLVEAVTLAPFYYYDFEFYYRNLSFTKFHSLFYFNESIRFVGSMWNNLYKL